MLLVPIYIFIISLISLLTAPLYLLNLAIPQGVYDAITNTLASVGAFQGIFPVQDLFIALNFVLGFIYVYWFIRLLFMFANMFPGVNLHLPGESRIHDIGYVEDFRVRGHWPRRK